MVPCTGTADRRTYSRSLGEALTRLRWPEVLHVTACNCRHFGASVRLSPRSASSRAPASITGPLGGALGVLVALGSRAYWSMKSTVHSHRAGLPGQSCREYGKIGHGVRVSVMHFSHSGLRHPTVHLRRTCTCCADHCCVVSLYTPHRQRLALSSQTGLLCTARKCRGAVAIRAVVVACWVTLRQEHRTTNQ
eukprot:COSAG05_NODE_1374_length_5050_cov_7.876591_1_plen_192_part_00